MFSLCSAATPLGRLYLVVDDREAIHVAFWEEQQLAARQHWHRWYRNVPWPAEGQGTMITEQVQRYFSVHPTCLDGVAVKPRGTTFQQKVWAALRAVPFGHPIRYGELGERVATRAAARAVGAALHRNPITLIVPCHRVIAANGWIGGYAGGVQRKLWLLDYEARVSSQARG